MATCAAAWRRTFCEPVIFDGSWNVAVAARFRVDSCLLRGKTGTEKPNLWHPGVVRACTKRSFGAFYWRRAVLVIDGMPCWDGWQALGGGDFAEVFSTSESDFGGFGTSQNA